MTLTLKQLLEEKGQDGDLVVYEAYGLRYSAIYCAEKGLLVDIKLSSHCTSREAKVNQAHNIPLLLLRADLRPETLLYQAEEERSGEMYNGLGFTVFFKMVWSSEELGIDTLKTELLYDIVNYVSKIKDLDKLKKIRELVK